MKILFDPQIFVMQQYGGISRYIFELVSYFAQDKTMSVRLPVALTHNAYLQDSCFLKGPDALHKRRFFGKTTLIRFSCNVGNKLSLLLKSYDIFHPTYYNPYFLRYLRGKPFVLTVYDMIHELMPELFPPDDVTRGWKQETIGRATKIIAISESTKKDLVRLYGIDEKKIKVIYLASSLGTADAAPPPFALPKKYLLFVGQRRDYKNFIFFVESIAPLLNRDPELTLLCTGGGAFTVEETDLLDKLRISGQVLQYSVSDKVLATLYKNALAFVFPSLYEGFGIPVLEAFSCGCPAILSNTSSLPEVGGEAARYFDPTDANSLCSAVAEVLSDRALRQEMVRQGLERSCAFSWEKTARQTKEIYAEAALAQVTAHGQ